MTRLSAAIGRIQPSATIAMAGRVNKLERAGFDVIGLSTGEPDFDTPEYVKEAAIAAIRAGRTKYTAVDGTAELKEAISKKFKRDNDLDFLPHEISVNVGAKHTLFNALVATIDPGDEVIIPAPHWVSYPEIVAFAGGTPVPLTAGANQGYKIIPEQLDAAINRRTRWLILNSPSNPSGAAYSGEEAKALGEVLRRHPHVMLITDDIYEHIFYAPFAFATMAQLCPDLRDRILTVNGCSKAYAMTGWRIGYAGGPAWLIGAMAKLQSQSTSSPCSIAQAAAAAALNGPQDFLVDRCATFKHRRDLVVDMLNDADGLSCPTPDGAFYVYPDASACIGKTTPKGQLIDCDEALVGYFLDEARVAVVCGAAFGLSPAFRVSYATSEDVLRAACSRIQGACAMLK